ncbi:MAG: 1-acyl-sn-glycerol-3-phosphate acyltransferase [Chloroflexi bacterium]|nr:1-acyl-sn-glycerol-3-phosphate acyltransferase [Chloroflexota bacterium]
MAQKILPKENEYDNDQIGMESLPKRGNRWTRAFAHGLMSICGWQIVGLPPNVPKALLIGAPHTSNWDFLLSIGTSSALGLRMSWMAKHTFVNGPGKRLWHWLGGVPVDRRAKHGAVGEMVEAFNNHEQLVVAITPEGTRSSTQGWKSGFTISPRAPTSPLCPSFLTMNIEPCASWSHLCPPEIKKQTSLLCSPYTKM